VSAPLVVNIPYKPNPKQGEFHGLKTKYRGFCGGWGNGKTTAGCVEFFARLMEYPGTNSIISRKTRPELRSTTWDMWVNGDTQEHGWRGVPKEIIKTYNKSDLYMEFINGSRVHGLPLDDPKKLENYNLGLFMIDQAEEVEEDIFLKFHGRLRQHGAPREGLLLFNPDGHNYLYRRFIDPHRFSEWKVRYKCIEATPFDNPNLPDDYLDQFAGLPEAWIQRYVYGSHDVFVGQIFTDWDEDIHIVQPFRIPAHWERWSCIDPGIRHEGCVSWIARSPKGDCFYYREHLEANRDISWWANKIMEYEMREDVGGPEEEIYRRLIGPEAKIRQQGDGKSVLDIYHEHGIYPEISDRDPVARINRLTEFLRPKFGHVHPFGAVSEAHDGAPRLYVFSTCDKFKEYLPQYRWRPVRATAVDEDAPEKPRKKDDHNIDCAGHILVALDDLPEMDDDSQILNAEQREFNEHFERELELASDGREILALPHRRGSGLVEEEEYAV
jgi:phage terminase large subunit